MTPEKQQQVHLYLGLDLGKRRDYSALAIVEYRRQWNLERNYVSWAMDPVDEETRFSVRQLQRIPLGTKYVDVASTVQRLLNRITQKYDCTLIVDATGVGQPVVEMFYAMPPRATMVPVVIIGAGSENKVKDEWRVPKQDLIAGLQIMLETEQLTIAQDLAFAPALLEELVEMRSVNGKSAEAGAGEHDDLVIAVALAAWRARRFAPISNGASTRTGFKNNAFGESIYGVGSSPSNWPPTPKRRTP